MNVEMAIMTLNQFNPKAEIELSPGVPLGGIQIKDSDAEGYEAAYKHENWLVATKIQLVP